MIRYSVREAACRAIHAGAARWKARAMKTHISRNVATARRPGRPIPAAMGTAGWAQAEAARARTRTVLRAPPDWRAPATTSVPTSTTKHGAPIAASADIVRTGGHALDPVQPRAGEQAETIGTRFHAQPFQAKLAVGRIDDPLEREADRVADSVASGRPVGAIAVAPSFGVQRECAECEEEEKKRFAANAQATRPNARRTRPPPSTGSSPGQAGRWSRRCAKTWNLDSDTTFQRCGCIRTPPLINQRETSMPMPTR